MKHTTNPQTQAAMTRINGKVQDSIKDNSFIEELKAGKSKE
jgi:hypothetical protein